MLNEVSNIARPAEAQVDPSALAKEEVKKREEFKAQAKEEKEKKAVILERMSPKKDEVDLKMQTAVFYKDATKVSEKLNQAKDKTQKLRDLFKSDLLKDPALRAQITEKVLKNFQSDVENNFDNHKVEFISRNSDISFAKDGESLTDRILKLIQQRKNKVSFEKDPVVKKLTEPGDPADEAIKKKIQELSQSSVDQQKLIENKDLAELKIQRELKKTMLNLSSGAEDPVEYQIKQQKKQTSENDNPALKKAKGEEIDLDQLYLEQKSTSKDRVGSQTTIENKKKILEEANNDNQVIFKALENQKEQKARQEEVQARISEFKQRISDYRGQKTSDSKNNTLSFQAEFGYLSQGVFDRISHDLQKEVDLSLAKEFIKESKTNKKTGSIDSFLIEKLPDILDKQLNKIKESQTEINRLIQTHSQEQNLVEAELVPDSKEDILPSFKEALNLAEKTKEELDLNNFLKIQNKITPKAVVDLIF